MTSNISFHKNTALLEFDAIGTRWAVSIYNSKLDEDECKKLQQVLFSEIEMYDKLYSRFRDDSLVQKIAQDSAEYVAVAPNFQEKTLQKHKKTYTFTIHSKELFDFYATVFSLTDGAFTPCIGQSLVNTGYDKNYSLVPKKNKEKHSVTAFDQLDIQSTDANNTTLTLHQETHLSEPLVLDFGAAGKGQLVDLLATALQNYGIDSFLVNGSGDIAHRHTQEIKVGLEHPNDQNKVIGVATIKNKSICGSATNRRSWDEYHHILNPFSQKSPTHIASTWVVANNTLEADGLATALYLANPDVLKAEFDFEYLILYTNGRVEKSSSFPGELYTP